jgi:hypothetical protein
MPTTATTILLQSAGDAAIFGMEHQTSLLG